MLSRQNLLILLVVILAASYVCLFTDWIDRPHIQIIAQTRPIRPRGQVAGVYPVSFLLDGKYRLTGVKVVPLNAFETNRFASPLWCLVADSNAPPTEGFLYGQKLAGLKQSVANAKPQRLEPNTVYRLFLEASRARGQIDFRTSGLIEPNN